MKTGAPVRRCEYYTPGALIHVEVAKFGNVPDGGGRRYVGRAAAVKSRAATPGKPKNKHYNLELETAFVHTVIHHHACVAYEEIHDDEKADTAIAVLRRAVS